MKTDDDVTLLSLEISTIQPVSLTARHGKPRDLFTIWFGSNITLLTIITGSLSVSIFHLSFLWSALAVLIGNLIGGVLMALHSAQGPQLGVPQMVQTRGQFGSYGSVLVIFLVVVMYIGFMASNLVLGGQSLRMIYPPLTTNGGIFIVALLSLVGTAFGYKLIHTYTKIMSWISGIILLVTFAWIVFIHGLPSDFWHRQGFNGVGFPGAISIAALWQLAYAPYVSDYSRYMPTTTPEKTVFWASYSGCVLGSFFPMILGILIATCLSKSDMMQGIMLLTGGLSSLVIGVFALGIATANAMNLYCGVLCTLTLGQTLIPRWSPLTRARVVTATVTVAVEIVIAIYGQSNFLINYTHFILMLLYVLVPWTAINLVDYYLIAHGNYDVASFFVVMVGSMAITTGKPFSVIWWGSLLRCLLCPAECIPAL